MPALLLDTTVLIDVLRGRPAADQLRALVRDEPPYVCAINVEELWRGARPNDASAVRRLLRGMRVVPLGVEEGEIAGTWRHDFASRGVTLSQADCLVAAAAASVGARLATGNPKDYPMSGVVVEHWPVGR